MSSSENQEVWLLFLAKIKFPVLSILKTGLMTMTSFQFTWFDHLVQFSKPHCETFCTPFELCLYNINNYDYALQNSEKPKQLTYAIPISKTHIPMPHQNKKKKNRQISRMPTSLPLKHNYSCYIKTWLSISVPTPQSWDYWSGYNRNN